MAAAARQCHAFAPFMLNGCRTRRTPDHGMPARALMLAGGRFAKLAPLTVARGPEPGAGSEAESPGSAGAASAGSAAVVKVPSSRATGPGGAGDTP